jgi:hypothetical protein
MDVATYRAHPSLSYSTLKAYLKSPLHGTRQYSPSESAAMRFGTVVDLAMKGQADSVIINPHEDGRTKEAKAWKAANEGKMVVTQSEHSRAMECYFSVVNHPAVKDMQLSMLSPDVALFGHVDGLDVKGLPDWWFGETVVDLKTTSGGVDAASFARTVDSFHYDMQAALYLELVKQQGEAFPDFYWVAVESDSPFDVAVYRATPEILRVGRAKLAKAIANAHRAKKGDVVGTSQSIQSLIMPNWYGREYTTDEASR